MAQSQMMAGAVTSTARPSIRRLTIDDLRQALLDGVDDFRTFPSHALFLVILYPIVGLCIAAVASGQNAFVLLYPLVAGFALLGPIAAIGLYEISREREQGLAPTTSAISRVFRSPSLPAIIALGMFLLVLFGVWLATAQALADAFLGRVTVATYSDFASQILGTPEGRSLIVVGNLVGLVFAIIALCVSVVSFPLLLDRDAGLQVAVQTSVRAVLANPLTMAIWGIVLAAGLALGFACLFVGLAVTLPILAHASWHLYRRTVSWSDAAM
jgi:uncharacterized membrane protein